MSSATEEDKKHSERGKSAKKLKNAGEEGRPVVEGQTQSRKALRYQKEGQSEREFSHVTVTRN